MIDCRLWFQKVTGLSNAVRQEPVADAAIFLRGKNVFANGQVVCVAVDKPEREHGSVPMIMLTQKIYLTYPCHAERSEMVRG